MDLVGVSGVWGVVVSFGRSTFSGMRILRMVLGVSWRLFLELVCYSALAFERSRRIYGRYFLHASMHYAM